MGEVVMAQEALFIGWGPPVRGREAKGMELYRAGREYFRRLEEDGRIEAMDVVILGLHGGDLYGFWLLRGSYEQLAELRADMEFIRLVTRSGVVNERVGVVRAWVGDEAEGVLSVYEEAVAALT
jgi:hypothetical protein